MLTEVRSKGGGVVVFACQNVNQLANRMWPNMGYILLT